VVAFGEVFLGGGGFRGGRCESGFESVTISGSAMFFFNWQPRKTFRLVMLSGGVVGMLLFLVKFRMKVM